MKRHLLLAVSLAALVLFFAVQLYMIRSVWRQKEEILLMRYRGLSREGLSVLLSKKKTNGFEKAMEVADKLAGYLVTEELGKLSDASDTMALSRMALKETTAILYKNEMLTKFLISFIDNAGFDKDFKSIITISKFEIFTPDGTLPIVDTVYSAPPKNLLFINTFREKHNNFLIEYHYLIDLTHKNRLVLREALLSFVFIIASTLIVFLVFWLTWSNLMEERRLSGLKSDFINNMTHELKTPLSTITVAGKTLKKEQILADPEKVLETADMIVKQSVHLNQMINTILEVSLLERTEFHLDRHPLAADELIHEIVSSFLTSCDWCAVIEEDYRTNSAVIHADTVHFTTIISNLLTNAVKYCDRDPVIKVMTTVECGNLEITISDNGIGIAREHLDHIFEKFYRVPHGNIHKTKGLGLGLYYVRRIAMAHGGDVSASSKQGRGTTFRIRLPLKTNI
ncbi:MAG: HAMP domain-containing sensor histidine kinase [Bacteroidales bacterium]|nr:HAMP domain-containing sensor histidine kinase [Bacteroidales bacterium]MDT8373211.1 HAMP domain-containing sensor histidine kinase [Bacteroidales bacterium]